MHRDPRAVREGTEQPYTRNRAVAGDGRDEGGLPEISARFPPRVERTNLKSLLPQRLGPGCGGGESRAPRVLRKQWPFVLPPHRTRLS